MHKSEKLLLKSKLRDAYLASDAATRKEIVQTYNELINENRDTDKRLNAHMIGAILPTVAVYKVLTRTGTTTKEARRTIRKSVLNAAKPMAKFFRTIGKLPFFFPLFRVMCPASMKGDYGGEGWRFEWKRNDAYAIEWECHSCLYVNVLTRYGMNELAPIFCESDDVMYGNIKNARWARTKTIGRGAELCNFRFYNPKKEGKKNGK